MTAITFDAAARLGRHTLKRSGKPASKVQGFLAMVSRALNAYVAYRVQKAVPEAELRRAARTIKRLSRPVEKVADRPVR
jgi:hypothetical protein